MRYIKNIICLVSLFFICSQSLFATDFYIAPHGDDSHSGSLSEPFATLERAQEAVRESIRNGIIDDINVILESGTYHLKQPLIFDHRDSGSDFQKITWSCTSNDKAILSGGRRISDWSHNGDNIWTTTISDVRSGKWFFRQLYADGQRLSRGRYPEDGFLKITGVSDDFKRLDFKGGLPSFELGGADTELIVVQNWSISREIIESNQAQSINAVSPIGWVKHTQCLPKVGASVFFEHSPHFLTKVNQWHLDRSTGVLTFKSPNGVDPNDINFVAPATDQLLRLEGTADKPIQNLHFRGLSFEHTNHLLTDIGYGGIQAAYYSEKFENGSGAMYAAPVAVEFKFTSNCSIQNSQFTRLGANGFAFSAGARNNRVTGSIFRDVGANGAIIGHMPLKEHQEADWKNSQEIPIGNEVSNCLFQDCAVDLWSGHAIFENMSQDSRIRHNEIFDMPYGGIATGLVWHRRPTSQSGTLIEYNHIYEVMLKLNDSGCIYTLGYQPGSIIRNNLLHGVRFGGYANGQICNNGIFMDQGSSGFLIEGNVIYDIDQEKEAVNFPVRFNNCNEEWQAWIDNTLSIKKTAPPEATELKKKAGLEPAFQYLRHKD